MAKKKDTAIPEMKCTICQATVTAETYATHIQTAHAAPPVVAPPTNTAWSQTPPAAQPWGGTTNNTNAPQPISGPIMGKDLAGGKYLKGEDIPEGTSEVRFRVIQFVRDPQGRSKLAAQINETYGKVLFGFNTTNIRAVVALGFLDMQQIVGKTVVCMLGMAPNPQKNGMPTKALFVSRIE